MRDFRLSTIHQVCGVRNNDKPLTSGFQSVVTGDGLDCGFDLVLQIFFGMNLLLGELLCRPLCITVGEEGGENASVNPPSSLLV